MVTKVFLENPPLVKPHEVRKTTVKMKEIDTSEIHTQPTNEFIKDSNKVIEEVVITQPKMNKIDFTNRTIDLLQISNSDISAYFEDTGTVSNLCNNVELICSRIKVINLCRQTEHALEKVKEESKMFQNSVNARNYHLTHILVMIVAFLILLGKITYTVSYKFIFCKMDSQINHFRKIHKKKFTQENHSGNNSSS